MINLNQANFKKEVLEAGQPVLVDFWAPWCGPCRMVAPIVEEIANDYSDKIKIGKVNVDENQELASEYGIMSIPTILIFFKGQLVSQLVGLRQKKEYQSEIDKHLS